MKKIKLFGDLAQFKSKNCNAVIDIPAGFANGERAGSLEIDWVLDVKTPSEALRAINANRPGFLDATKNGDYAVLLVSDKKELSRRVLIDNANDPWGDEIMMVVPVPRGETGFEVIAGFVASALFTAGVSAGVASFIGGVVAALVNIGLALAVSAIANVITGDKKATAAGTLEKYDSKPSFISNGAVNLVRAGNPYPILVGRVRDAGSIVLSSNYYVEDIPV